jgi:hypothetical protein
MKKFITLVTQIFYLLILIAATLWIIGTIIFLTYCIVELFTGKINF